MKTISPLYHTRNLIEAYQHAAPANSATQQAIAVRSLQEIETAELQCELLAEFVTKLQISTTTLETVLQRDPGNVAAQVCIKNNRALLGKLAGVA
jgi:hypothetical protein